MTQKESRKTLLFLVVVLAVIAGGLAWLLWPSQVEIRNVLLISLDTTRADRLSCYGFDKPTTPRHRDPEYILTEKQEPVGNSKRDWSPGNGYSNPRPSYLNYDHDRKVCPCQQKNSVIPKKSASFLLVICNCMYCNDLQCSILDGLCYLDASVKSTRSRNTS